MSRQLAFGESAALTPADLRALVGVPLSQAQLDAATAALEPGVIVAGAGTGKTTVMAARVVWLVASGAVAPDQVLGLTFTTKAAAQLAAKVRAALRRPGVLPEGDDDPGEPQVSTYHAFAARLLVEHGVRLGVEPTSRLLTDASRYQLAHRVVCRPPAPFLALDESPTALVKKVLALDDALAEHGVSPQAMQAWDAALIARLAAAAVQQKTGEQLAGVARRRIDLAGLVTAFRQAKLERDVHDFADQTRLAARLAAEHPAVGAAVREQFAVVMLDEYQDTSTAQRHLLASLFGQGHPVTAVGDPCQAIYGWRGASVHNIDAFPQHFPAVDSDGSVRPARRYTLVENRRSGPVILDVANDVARRLREEHPGVAPLVPGTDAKGRGEVRCALLETVDDEIAWVADRVAAQRGLVARWDEVAVLCRTTAEFGALKRALEAREVPVEVVGTAGLLALPEVVEIVSVLRVLHDPTANPAFVRLLTGPRWRIGPRDLAALGAYAEGLASGRRPRGTAERRTLDEELDDAVVGADPTELVSLSDAVLHLAADVEISPQARERLSRLARQVRALRRHVGEPLVDLVHRVLAVTGLDVEIAAAPGAVAAGSREAVEAFTDLVAGFRDAEGDPTLGALLRWLDDAERFDAAPGAEGPSGRDAVSLMTVHKAKGLEFPVVALPFLACDDFPLKRTQELWTSSPTAVPHDARDEPVPLALRGFPPQEGPRAADLTRLKDAWRDLHALEEVRLGYVAVTRAERLLLASASFWPRGVKTPRLPGPFLLAVREAALAGAGQVDAWADPPDDGAANPLREQAAAEVVPWPVPLDPAGVRARREAAADVRAAQARLAASGWSDTGDGDVLEDAWAVLGDERGPAEQEWDADLRLVLAALAADDAAEVVVPLPESMSASALLALAEDPEAFLADLVRPMPRRPSRAAGRGTRFHAWVEARFGQQPMLDPDDLPGAADDELDDAADLADLQAGFERTPYADLTPYAVEAPFALVLAGRVVRGRIDAVYRYESLDPQGRPAVRWEVVDWKTGRAGSADPLQLAVYRLAWAEQHALAPADVAATFVHVATSTVERHDDLPERDELEALLSGSGGPAGTGPRTPPA